MSLDETLDNLNATLTQVAELLKAIEVAVIVIAITLAITLIGCTAIYYYSKYKKYQPLSESSTPPRSTYKRGLYHGQDQSV
ncbi:unnamed protein product [Caenorhabditis angaria]|uniref:Uncharacterized protein n=1 Tax=Caenorhabditis angaria TaxID=860376 RepID=A0A9P1N8L3_9PELO|nr:unnamed protein product [Caenorhabditis angaria]